MGIYKFIAIKGIDGPNTGYFVPNMYRLHPNRYIMRARGLSYIITRLRGWTIWWVANKEDYVHAIKTLDELKKTRIFTYKVSK